MQILHPFAGSVQQYVEQLADPEPHRPRQCPQCAAKRPLTAHGFYRRTLVDTAFDGWIRIRRYLCQACHRTVSLLPEFVLPYLRFSITVIALWLLSRLGPSSTSKPTMPYQRGQFWVRRFLARAEALCLLLAALVRPPAAPDFPHRALAMLATVGWIGAHRFLLDRLRQHLLGWPKSLAPHGRRVTLGAASASA
jgi:transposase-like protein